MIKITADLEQEYSTLYIGGLLSDAQLHDNLTAIGLQDDYANAVAAKAEARRAAMRRFVSGGSTAAERIAVLGLTGLTPIQTAAFVELAALQKGGNLRWLYGRQLSPGDATLLRQRVAALTDQRKRQQITDQQYHDQLAALGLGAHWVNALRATADAMISPAKSAFEIPVETNGAGQ